MQNEGDFYKRKETDTIWWIKGGVGEWLFSFDRKKVYNMYRDYPHAMTPEEVAIFDKENPFWADYFADRKR